MDALLEALKADLTTSMDTMFVLFSGFLVFLMQPGFAMLSAGSVRTRNVTDVLVKNIVVACVSGLSYWLFGYAFAYGSDSNRFLGTARFAPPRGNDTEFFFQWVFAATSANIVAGSIAERASFYAYFGYAFLHSGFVYPVVTHWVWSGAGFLGDWGVVDFAGSAVVHMVGGLAGLVGAAVVGPRSGRFVDGKVVAIPGHSAPLCTLGTFMLWLGWYGFNPGSALSIQGELYKTVGRCAVTTSLAAVSAGLTTLFMRGITDRIVDLITVLNGILAGLVAISASCAFVETYAAVAIGAVGAIVYFTATKLLLKLKIDDPLEAFPIYAAPGFWGVLACGLFSRRDLLLLAGFSTEYAGLVEGGKNAGRLLWINLTGALIIAAWTAVLMGTFFLALKAGGRLRICSQDGLRGNDLNRGDIVEPAAKTHHA